MNGNHIYYNIIIINKMATTDPKNNKKKIYLITDRKSNDILLNLLKEASFVSEVRIGSPNIIPELTESFLSLFDCFIYDLKDAGFGIDTNKEKEIRNYIENDGGSFLVTHDHWDYCKGPLDLIGLEYDNNNPYIYSDKAKEENHPQRPDIYNSYHNLTYSNTFNISRTHKSNHKIKENTSAKVVMTLYTEKANNNIQDYLVINEVGKGRIAYWAAGHSNTISDEEKKIFINIVAWLTQYKK